MRTINERIAALQAKMKTLDFHACIMPTNDPHQSEYVADHWKSREYFSGFTGSAGVLVVTLDKAVLWTDGRYFLQADEELVDSVVTLGKYQIQGAPEHVPWMAGELAEGSTVSIDGDLFSTAQLAYMESVFDVKNISVNLDHDLMDGLWEDRPELPLDPIFEHEVKYAGRSREQKLAQVRTFMKSAGATHYLVTALDELAWVLNVRGSDVTYNPVAIAYLVIEMENCSLFINPSKVNDQIKSALQSDGIALHPYAEVNNHVGSLSPDSALFCDRGTVSVKSCHFAQCKLVMGASEIQKLKAVKNEVEIGHFRNVMVKDCVALTRFYRWLESTLETETIKESDVALKLTSFRKAEGLYFGDSFGAIVGYKGNGAIIHYSPKAETSASIEKEGMLLIDSGGQYFDGTTDITRTTTLSEATEEQKTNFTRVLKGYIALETIRFPRGTVGMQLDTLARMHLWKAGLNFGHGTGHGVGFFLNVHEPPQGFAPNAGTSRGVTAFTEGMVTSNEPGFYKTDAYGIRFENLLLCVHSETTAYGDFLAFEPITLFPVDLNLVDRTMLSAEEISWINNYHDKVYNATAPHLNVAEQTWLKNKCGKL